MDSDFEDFEGEDDDEDGDYELFEGVDKGFGEQSIHGFSDDSDFSVYEDEFEDCWTGIMDVRKTERYWEKLLACRFSLLGSSSPKDSLTFLNAVDKWINKFGDKVLKNFSIGYTMGFFVTLIFPKLIKAPKKLKNKIRIKLRDNVEMLLAKLQYSLVAKAQL